MSRRGMPPVTDALLKVDMINQRPARKSLVQVRSRSQGYFGSKNSEPLETPGDLNSSSQFALPLREYHEIEGL